MGEGLNRSLRIHTNVGESENTYVSVKLDQDYDTFDILSMSLTESDAYKLHNGNYGVIAGRVIANGGFGVPNAKVSIFIESIYDENTDVRLRELYPYTSIESRDSKNKRFNLLPNKKVNDCHQAVGSFPNKTYLLDNNLIIEVFDTYYKYTTRTNNSGDYMICGVPTGSHTLHMDLDLSDCGILSQRPRDFVYKGYNIEQFENPNQFKEGNELESLSQIFTQNQSINVVPFWGDSTQGETIGITRADINVSFKFEPTCVFMGSVVSDDKSNGISIKCIPTNEMGAMDKLTTGEGTIEMIRKTPGGNVEEFQIKGNELIDSNGVWCYQIPMNLDYVRTDEYGNMVPTDDPDKGIPTRARVRFRVSLNGSDNVQEEYFRGKMLVPNNPSIDEDIDYNFGTSTEESSYRDLFWNNVYSVKSYIPRIQKGWDWRNDRFTGIKNCNISDGSNPIPYNNLRVKMPLMYTIMCRIITTLIGIVNVYNGFKVFLYKLLNGLYDLCGSSLILRKIKDKIGEVRDSLYLTTLEEGFCPDLDGWYFAPSNTNTSKNNNKAALKSLLENTLGNITGENLNGDDKGEENACITIDTSYLLPCIEMNLAREYKVIKFDFYNDWINGMIYIPRWKRTIKTKTKTRKGETIVNERVKGCMADSTIFGTSRRYVQACNLLYNSNGNSDGLYTNIASSNGCGFRSTFITTIFTAITSFVSQVITTTKVSAQGCHRRVGIEQVPIFGKRGGLVSEKNTIEGQKVYYLKPKENTNDDKRVNLFATDLILLGSLNDCDLYGIPQAFKYLTSTSYKLPTNLALTNLDSEEIVFTGEEGTLCSGRETETTVGKASNNFEGQALDTENKSYEGLDDAIPVTEVAGIAWNYTGPGQKQIIESKLSNTFLNKRLENLNYPGGHFLGISCKPQEVQVNIKSCVNLKRACELGTGLSQRHEVPISVDEETGKITYEYLVPSGLISKDDINAGEFRSMFATMNAKRLIADEKYDDKTGYPIYDFTYNRAYGFDGGLKDKIKKASEYYNSKVEVDDEMEALGLSVADSYDSGEKDRTYVRTIESVSNDYYLFRMGINNKKEQKAKFLNVQNGTYSLPQYENSFYFYFGLKEGATAIDEFNKQFYSTCAKNDSSIAEPEIIIRSFNSEGICAGGELMLQVENMTAPYNVILTPKRLSTPEIKIQSSTNLIKISDVPVGTYEIKIVDGNEVSVTTTQSLGDVEIGNTEVVDFQKPFSGTPYPSDIIQAVSDELDNDFYSVELGGYFGINPYSVIVDQEEIQFNNSNVLLITNGEDYIESSGKISADDTADIPMLSRNSYLFVKKTSSTSDWTKICLWDTNANYNVYYGKKCSGTWKWILLTSFTIKGKDNAGIYLGNKFLPYKTVLKYLRSDCLWWSNLSSGNPFSGDTSDLHYKKIVDNLEFYRWALKHFVYKQASYLSESAVTFDSQVYALDENGKEAESILFGLPENEEGILTGGTRSIYTNRVPNYYAGYELSDKDSYRATCKVNINEECGRKGAGFYRIGVNSSDSPFVEPLISGAMSIYGHTFSTDRGIETLILQVSMGTSEFEKITGGDPYLFRIANKSSITGEYINVSYISGEINVSSELGYVIDTYETDNSFTDKVSYDDLYVLNVYKTFKYPVIYHPFYVELPMIINLQSNLSAIDDEIVVKESGLTIYIADSHGVARLSWDVSGFTDENTYEFPKTDVMERLFTIYSGVTYNGLRYCNENQQSLSATAQIFSEYKVCDYDIRDKYVVDEDRNDIPAISAATRDRSYGTLFFKDNVSGYCGDNINYRISEGYPSEITSIEEWDEYEPLTIEGTIELNEVPNMINCRGTLSSSEAESPITYSVSGTTLGNRYVVNDERPVDCTFYKTYDTSSEVTEEDGIKCAMGNLGAEAESIITEDKCNLGPLNVIFKAFVKDTTNSTTETYAPIEIVFTFFGDTAKYIGLKEDDVTHKMVLKYSMNMWGDITNSSNGVLYDIDAYKMFGVFSYNKFATLCNDKAKMVDALNGVVNTDYFKKHIFGDEEYNNYEFCNGFNIDESGDERLTPQEFKANAQDINSFGFYGTGISNNKGVNWLSLQTDFGDYENGTGVIISSETDTANKFYAIRPVSCDLTPSNLINITLRGDIDMLSSTNELYLQFGFTPTVTLNKGVSLTGTTTIVLEPVSGVVNNEDDYVDLSASDLETMTLQLDSDGNIVSWDGKDKKINIGRESFTAEAFTLVYKTKTTYSSGNNNVIPIIDFSEITITND